MRDRASFIHCATEAELLASLKGFEGLASQGQKRRLSRSLGVAQKLHQRLHPFFDALNVIIGTEPFAAIGYGAFRIILQYEVIEAVFRGKAPARLSLHLEAVYKDLFEVLRVLAGILTGSRGTTLVVMNLWSPFESKLEGIITRMDEHRRFVLDELQILQLEGLKRADRDAARERQCAEKQRQLEAEARRHIEELSKSTTAMAAELHRDRTGWGKTVLAASVGEELLQDSPDFSGEELGYFFFRHADPKQSSIDAAYRSVLAQILHRNRNDCILIDKFLFAKYGTKSLGQLMASSTELLSLVHACASHFGHLRFVFDGLDEASGDDNMAQSFKSLICTWPISLMCFSRTNVRRMSTVVPDTRTISLTRAITGSDIEAYLSSQLLNLVDDELLPAGSIQPLLDRLVRGADGMFLWAKLMIRFLNSAALSPRSRIEHIQTIIYPEGLEAMYDRILRLIIGSEGPESKLARGVFSWLSSSMADTHTDHMGLLRWFMGTYTDNADVPDATFLSMIMSACCGLIESVWCYVVIGVGGSGSMELREVLQIRFVHMSVKMFFAEMQGRPDAYAGLVPTRVASSAGIMQRCLLTLLEHAPSTAPPRLLGAWHHIFSTEDMFAQSYIAYSTKYWIKHLEEALVSRARARPRSPALPEQLPRSGSAGSTILL
ncbi:hypothetical protein CKAH01_16308 [Colletotrichum kahawae]|uniref:Nephrocystin 3-like N-terminal domain-containing protein n=1 Tax=Colletotrichum kahawae TaxID=34407 RepID=A0AAD9YFU0_COLKA|nr:hypothetical protein CKAH01_16308 [Colletotrichum kahawae]